MIRTEVVQTKKFRKSLFYKASQVIILLFALFLFFVSLEIVDKESIAGKLFPGSNNALYQSILFGFVFVFFIFSMIITSQMKNPARLGALEIDEKEVRFFHNDQLIESYAWADLRKLSFEFFSTRQRKNPLGSMNYLTLHSGTGQKTYEIIVENSLIKEELGDLLSNIQKTIPVEVRYTIWLKRLIGDKAFPKQKVRS